MKAPGVHLKAAFQERKFYYRANMFTLRASHKDCYRENIRRCNLNGEE